VIAERNATTILRDPFTNKPYVHFYATKRIGGQVVNSEAIKLLKFNLPAALRHGILRLAAHFYTHRASEGAPGGEPPAAVTALWRPYRRLRLR
jgi:hypothetical protein